MGVGTPSDSPMGRSLSEEAIGPSGSESPLAIGRGSGSESPLEAHHLLPVPAQSPLEAHHLLPVPAPCIGVNVLLIEDDSMQIHFMREIFDASNKELHPHLWYSVFYASTAAAALQVAVERCSDIHLIICDVHIDGCINGVDIVKQLAEVLPSTTAVVMTSCDHALANVRETLMRGVDAFYPKPMGVKTVMCLWQHCWMRCNRSPRPPPPLPSAGASTEPNQNYLASRLSFASFEEEDRPETCKQQ